MRACAKFKVGFFFVFFFTSHRMPLWVCSVQKNRHIVGMLSVFALFFGFKPTLLGMICVRNFMDDFLKIYNILQTGLYSLVSRYPVGQQSQSTKYKEYISHICIFKSLQGTLAVLSVVHINP